MELRTEELILAPRSRVWQVLVDFPAYHAWNPFIVQISGEQRVGGRLKVTVAQPEGPEMIFKPRVLVYEPECELRWLGQLWFKGLFSGEHFFQLKEEGPDATRIVHGENFKGILLKLMGQSLTRTARGFVYMNQALKKRVEMLNSGEPGAPGLPQ